METFEIICIALLAVVFVAIFLIIYVFSRNKSKNKNIDPISVYMTAYTKCYDILKKSNLVGDNLDFELLPVVSIALLNSVESDAIKQKFHENILNTMRSLPTSFEDFKSEYYKRIEFYESVKSGKPLIGSWCLGHADDIAKDSIGKIVVAFGDVLLNPSCAVNYENAPIQIHSIFDITNFATQNMKSVSDILYSLDLIGKRNLSISSFSSDDNHTVDSNTDEKKDSEHTNILDSIFAFGSGGLMLLVSSILTLFPLYMAKVPFWLWLIIVICIRFMPAFGFLIDSAIWIAGLVFAVQGEQTSVSVLFYITFAFWFFVYGLNYIRNFVSLIPRKERTKTNKKFHLPVNRRKVIRTVIISVLSVCIVLGSFHAIFLFASVGRMQGDWYSHTEKPLVKIKGTHITYDGWIYDGTIAGIDKIVFHDSSCTLDFSLRGDSLVLQKKYKTGTIYSTRIFRRNNAVPGISDMVGTWRCGNNTITINDSATIFIHGDGNVTTIWNCMSIDNNSICKMSITEQFIHYIFTYKGNDTIIQYTYNSKGELLYEQVFERVIE